MEFWVESLGLLDFNLRKVALFPDVFFQIEELNRSALEVFEQFVITVADGATRTLHLMITVVQEMPIN